MRLPFFTLFLSNLALFSLFPTLVSSTHPHALVRRRDYNRSSVPHVLTSRQHHIARDLLDVCINVNVDLLANASQLLGLESVLAPLDLGAKVELCLCLKDLDIYLETNDEAQVLVGLLGKSTVGALITALINTSPDARHCTFPSNAHHTCNTHDPCHYECDPPYVPQGGVCVCASPYLSCNGVCGIFPQGCGSAAPRSIQARANPIATLSQAQASCKPYETVCGIPGRESALAFECINTRSTKDSCGGCMTPHPFFETEPIRHSSGKDCTTISQARRVTCSEERCLIHTCTNGWTPSSDKSTCTPIPGSSSKMRRVVKRSDLLNLDAIVGADLDSDLVSQVVAIVHLVLGLADAPIQLGSPGSGSDADIPIVDAALDLLAGVNASTAALITSLTNPASLLVSVDGLLNKTTLLLSTLTGCSCHQYTGLSDTLKSVDNLLAATLALRNWCTHNVTPTHPVGSTGPSPSAPSSDIPIVVGVSKLLTDLRVLGPVTGVVAIDGLGSDIDNNVNGVLDALNIGPHDVKKRAPVTGTVLSTPAWVHGLHAPTSASTTPKPRDIPIVSSSNNLLEGLGLGGIKDVATVDGLLGNDLDSGVDGLLDELDIGPHDAKRDVGKRQGSMKERRQILANAGVTADLSAGLVVGVDALVDAVLGLVTAGKVLPSAPSTTSLVAHTTTLSVGGPSRSSSVSVPGPSSLPPDVNKGLVDTVVGAVQNLLSILSYTEFTSSVDALISASVTSLGVLEGCSCADEVYSYLLKIVEAAQVLRSCQLPTSTPDSSAGHRPLAVGLTKLLNGLGLNIQVGAVVGGLLSDGADDSVNALLDGLGIGANGFRRRIVSPRYDS
ncbi:hypothetical protein GALMADRAFT_137075 [Galerina marginata CBS 339.88]|uniref:Protein CPL1-like domain-containing protein n=1 Tax=Galerina marginata (strain CBS 339.88) TaxID=685588 RepID=A0A067TJN4_GALM3|nr:hypothetical protein GALMADRAFT_137075 [Galerina marginata CBS 339.88]